MPRLHWKWVAISAICAAAFVGHCRADTIVYDDDTPVVTEWEPDHYGHVVHYYNAYSPNVVVDYDGPEYFNDGSQRYEARPSYQTAEYFSSYYW